MNLKRFLKPDKRKILVFIILCCIYLVADNLHKTVNVLAMSNSEYHAYTTLLELYGLFFILFGLPMYILKLIEILVSGGFSIFWSNNPVIYALNVLGLVLTVIWWYLISCLIIRIYDKLRKKPVEKKRK